MNGDLRINITVDKPERWILLSDVDFSTLGLDLDPSQLASKNNLQYIRETNAAKLGDVGVLEESFKNMCDAFDAVSATECKIACDLYYFHEKYVALWYKCGQYAVIYNCGAGLQSEIHKERLIDDNPISDIDEWLLKIGAGAAVKENYDFEENGSGYKLLKYKSDAENVVIPRMINGVKVTEIADRCFYGKNMVAVTLPDLVCEIGSQAFAECKSLRKITFDRYSCVNIIHSLAFDGCSSLKQLFLPNSITVLEESSLYGCPLEFIYFGNCIRTINGNIFMYNGRKTLPDKVKAVFKSIYYIYEYIAGLDIGTEFHCVYDSTEYYTPDPYRTDNTDIYTDFEICPINTDFVKKHPSLCVEYDREKYYKKTEEDLKGVEVTSVNIVGPKIYIPETISNKPVVWVEFNDFYSNHDFEEVYLSKTVQGVENGLMDLDSVSVDPENPYIMADKTGVYSKDKTVLFVAMMDKESNEYVIQNTVKTIMPKAFKKFYKVNRLFIGDSLENIVYDEDTDYTESVYGYGWSSFKHIEVSDKNMNFKSQDGCLYSRDKTKLLKVPMWSQNDLTVAEEVKEISPTAFGYNHNINKIRVPGGVKQLSADLFIHCSALRSTELYNIEEGKNPFCLLNGDKLVKYIGRERKVVIPNGVKSIKARVFADAYTVEEIVFPEGIQTIGDKCFCGCSNLKSIKLPGSVKKIGSDAFMDCKALESIVLPASACAEDFNDPDSAMFFGCKNLSVIRIEGRLVSGTKDNASEKLRLFGSETFRKTAVKSFVAPNVPLSAFPEKLQKYAAIGFIEEYMRTGRADESVAGDYFARVKKISSFKSYINNPLVMKYVTKERLIKLSNIDTYIKMAFDEGDVEKQVFFMNYKNEAFTAEELTKYEERKLKKIENELLSEPAPEGSKKKTQKKEIDKTSDKYMEKVWKIRRPYNNTSQIWRYKGEDTELVFPTEVGGVKIDGISKRSGKTPDIYSKISSVVIPEGYTSIGSNAFDGCTSLERVELPSTLEYIYDRAFAGCVLLESVDFPKSLKYIGMEAFAGCEKLEKLILPTNTEGSRAFKGCTALRDVYVLNPFRKIGASVFSGCRKVVLHVADDSELVTNFGPKRIMPINDRDGYEIAKKYLSEPMKVEFRAKLNSDLPLPKIGDELAVDSYREIRDQGTSIEHGWTKVVPISKDGNVIYDQFVIEGGFQIGRTWEKTLLDFELIGFTKYLKATVMEKKKGRKYMTYDAEMILDEKYEPKDDE